MECPTKISPKPSSIPRVDRRDGRQRVRGQLIRPALDGTRNVLNSVDATPSVKHMVLPSSMAAMYGDRIELAGIDRLTEEDWNATSIRYISCAETLSILDVGRVLRGHFVQTELGIGFRPAEQSIVEHYQQMLDDD